MIYLLQSIFNDITKNKMIKYNDIKIMACDTHAFIFIMIIRRLRYRIGIFNIRKRMLVSLPRCVNHHQMRTRTSRRDDAAENGVNWPTKVADERIPRVLLSLTNRRDSKKKDDTQKHS
jgi:hypothetical protein